VGRAEFTQIGESSMSHATVSVCMFRPLQRTNNVICIVGLVGRVIIVIPSVLSNVAEV
jgi:hypothetical protein